MCGRERTREESAEKIERAERTRYIMSVSSGTGCERERAIGHAETVDEQIYALWFVLPYNLNHCARSVRALYCALPQHDLLDCIVYSD